MADFDVAPSFQTICKVPFGWITVTTSKQAVRQIDMSEFRPAITDCPNALGETVCKSLQRWFEGGVWPQGIPLQLSGTAFQKKVWEALLDIPSGETRTYGDLARQLQSGSRAVGGACRRNPVPLLVPCHRVVAANGDGGFAGHTDGFWMSTKRWLLAHE